MSTSATATSDAVKLEKHETTRDILKMLNIADENGSIKQALNALFNNMTDNIGYKQSESSLKRIKIILKLYTLWINKKEKEKKNNNFYDAVNIGLSNKYHCNLLAVDFKFVTENKELLIGDEEENKKSDYDCDASQCYILKRSNRDRALYRGQTHKTKALFFIDGNRNDIANMLNNIAFQELMDNIHCYMSHTLRLSAKTIEKKLNEAKDGNNNNNEYDDTYDERTDVICSLIENTYKTNKRFRDIRRFTKGHNKFVTSNAFDKSRKKSSKTTTTQKDYNSDANVAVYQSMVYGNNSLILSQEKKEKEAEKEQKEDICLMGALYMELREISIEEKELEIDNKLLNEYRKYIVCHEYESDALSVDLEKKKESNVICNLLFVNNSLNLKRVNGIHSIYSICSKFVTRCNNKMTTYSCGFRYFYWPFYKNNHNEQNVVWETSGGGMTEGNAGYNLSEWYIDALYSNLKEEALNNTCAPFGIYEYNLTYHKAANKLNQWNNDENAKPLTCRRYYWKKQYGINRGDSVGLDHIICLLFYCNFTTNSYEFSRTYRKIHAFESDRNLKKRHSQLAIWGKKIREIVECFGLCMDEATGINVFYHGINTSMIFKSTGVTLSGPVSTTLDFMIAVNSFASEGIVIDIQRTVSVTFYFNCKWWSDFSHEDERLFIGGLQPFWFLTIRQIPQRKNFANFVLPFTMFQLIIEGYPMQDMREPHKKDLKYLRQMINDELSNKYIMAKKAKTDTYILRLFHHCVINIHHLIVNLHWMNTISYDWKEYDIMLYGYIAFKPLFLSDDNTLNIYFFLSLFIKTETFTIFSQELGEYQASILLTDEWIYSIIKTIKTLKAHKSLRKGFKQFIIVRPQLLNTDCIQNVIEKYNKLFIQIGWQLKQITYKNIARPGKAVNDTLSIQKTL